MYLHDYYYGMPGGNNCSNNASVCKKSWIHISHNDFNLSSDNDDKKYFK